MRSMFCAVIVLACMGGAALAQQDIVVEPTYVQRPTGRDFARNYPERAMERSISGAAVLCCSPQEDRSLSCEARADYPTGEGFGRASETISRQFRLSEQSYAQWQEDPHPMRVPIVWAMGAGRGAQDARNYSASIPANICEQQER